MHHQNLSQQKLDKAKQSSQTHQLVQADLVGVEGQVGGREEEHVARRLVARRRLGAPLAPVALRHREAAGEAWRLGSSLRLSLSLSLV